MYWYLVRLAFGVTLQEKLGMGVQPNGSVGGVDFGAYRFVDNVLDIVPELDFVRLGHSVWDCY